MLHKLLRITFLSLVISACSQPAETGGFSAENEWIREAPPGMRMMAGYATLTNTSGETINVVGVESPAFGAIEMHTTKVVDGTARMIEQEKLSVPAGGSLELAPGGYHLMLMMPKKQLIAGDHVSMTFALDNGTKETLDFEVKKGGSGTMDNHHQH